jgi:non-homologous end joining protein Ku
MPRASWSGFLRLSLVSCPIYLSPATTRTKSIRLHQVWRPVAANEPDADEPDRNREEQVASGSRPQVAHPTAAEGADQTGAATRIALRPHDPRTGGEAEKSQVVKGYEYDRDQFVTFSAEELKALDVDSSKVIDLERFVSRGDVDPVYFDTPYYLHPDGSVAVEALRVIGVAMAEAGVAGIGRLTLSRRERMVMVEASGGTGMALFTLRAADEIRMAQFRSPQGDLDAEMVTIARAIIRQRTGKLSIGCVSPSHAREETPESRRMPYPFLNTELDFGGKPPKKSGFRRHLAGSKMPKKCLRRRFLRRSPVGEWSRRARSMPRVFGRGSRSQPAARVSDRDDAEPLCARHCMAHAMDNVGVADHNPPAGRLYSRANLRSAARSALVIDRFR